VKAVSSIRAALGAVFHDLPWKAVSLAVAVILWIIVASEPELSTFISVPVQYKDLPEGLEINSDLIESVYLELRGPSGELRGGSEARHYAVVLDMSGVHPGERTFSIDDRQVRLARGIRLVRAIPSQIRFEFERRAYDDVPVHVRFANAAGTPEQAAHVGVEPPSLRIVGPESRVNRVRFVETDPIDVAGLTGSREFRVNCFLDDPHIRFAVPSQVKVTVQTKGR